MGITGLIPFLEKSSSRVHLKDIRGCTVAIDTYCWLHKGVFSCAEKLVRGEETDQYIFYCLKYVQMLLSYDIKPILVFDGRHLPAKAITERRRREARQLSKKRAAELLRIGQVEEARSHMRRSVDVTHEMALKLIRECRQRNIDCIVAPYEADAQMAWLNIVDMAQYVITEDSDLTLFGARRIIFKLDLAGGGLLVETDKLYLSMGCRQEKYTIDKFRRMCILSGCDYLDSLPGIGLVKACKFILMTQEEDMRRALKKIPQYLNMKNLEVDDEYIESFLKAEATFKHMYIYNPLKRKMERLRPLDCQTDERYCSNAGTPMEDNEQAFQLALGNLNPFTLKKLDNWHPNQNFGLGQASTKNIKRAKHKSIWQANFDIHRLQPETENDGKESGTSCALYFKKVDFISKTIDEEISATTKEENAKPEEAEVYSMYRHEAEENRKASIKRIRLNTSSSSSNADLVSPPASPVSTKMRHNPFAKGHSVATEDSLQKSPKVCENSSLLKILSPKKSNKQLTEHSTRINNLKRKIFTTQEDQHVQVEVKSRFFEANLKKVTKRNTPPPDLVKEMDDIDHLCKPNELIRAQLYYNSPPRPEEDTESHADSGIGSTAFATDATDKILDDIPDSSALFDKKHDVSKFMQNTACNPETESSAENANIISIGSSEDEAFDQTPLTTNKNENIGLQLSAFKPKTGPRLGLSKTKSSLKLKNSSKVKKTDAASNSGQNQTRLSMFGFQKRPTLK